MQKGLYLTTPSGAFVVVKKKSRGTYARTISTAIKSSQVASFTLERSYLKALLIPYPVLMWSKDDD